MHCIQNLCIGTPTPFNKALAGFTSVSAITVIALSFIGLSASPSGPFNAMVQFGVTINGILLGTSIFVFILDLVWIAAICKENELSVPQGSYQLKTSKTVLPNPKSFEQPPPKPVLVSEIEEINDTDYFSQLPEEIILRTFGFLNAIDQAKCGEVSRRWRRLASDETLLAAFNLKDLSHLLTVFDESDWVTHFDLSAYGLDMEDLPPLDLRKTAAFLESVLSSSLMTEIEGNAGVTLLTIPKGLTFNTLVKLAGSPKKGNTPKFRFIWEPIPSEIGDIPVDKTYRVIITNKIFEKTKKLIECPNFINNTPDFTVSNQKAFVSQIGCEMPRVLEATVLLVATVMVTGERLYHPWIYTLCSEQIAGKQLAVGSFSPEGLSVAYYDFAPVPFCASGVLRLAF